MDLRRDLQAYINGRIERIRELLSGASADLSSEELRNLGEDLRAARIMASVLESMQLWQAPALATSATDPTHAGVEHGSESAAIFNFAYMRQYAPRIEAFELAFAREYGAQGQACVLTGSGIGAINLALEAVLRVHDDSDVEMLCVGDPYGEAEDLLAVLHATRTRVHLETIDSSALLTQRLLNPPGEGTTRILYADAIENSPGMRVFRTETLASLPGRPGLDYLVLDRTLVGHLWRPRLKVLLDSSNWTVIEVESLTKYHQLGADIVTAGAVLFPKCFIERFQDPILRKEAGLHGLWRLRANHGWSPATASSALLPSPREERQTNRLGIHYRNARLVAATVARAGLSGWTVVHPSLPTHPDYETSSQCGLVFLCSDHDFEVAIDHFLEAARLEEILVSKRGSFGFNETTVDSWKNHIRISAGMEEEAEARRLADVLVHVLRTPPATAASGLGQDREDRGGAPTGRAW